jgi:nitroimidazol reductase NimA-like FMN-containing flavoprotein (pyridoxamine 5'-phosphate oxidase superfamily)
MGVRLTEDEAWEMLTNSHTGIITTLRRDGWPVSLPMWFAVVDRKIYMRTLAASKKALRIKHDERACFIVESGKAWKDLASVVVPVRASLIDPDGEEARRALAAITAKYQGFGLPQKQVPEATRKHYGAGNVVIRMEPAGHMITWNNAKIRLKEA